MSTKKKDTQDGQTQALSRIDSLEPQTKTGKGKEGELLEIVDECERAEAQAYASRGYGGYIKTEHITSIRETKAEAVAELLKLGIIV